MLSGLAKVISQGLENTCLQPDKEDGREFICSKLAWYANSPFLLGQVPGMSAKQLHLKSACFLWSYNPEPFCSVPGPLFSLTWGWQAWHPGNFILK